MHKKYKTRSTVVLFLLLVSPLMADQQANQANEQAPSFQEKEWTGKRGSSELNVEYDYIGPVHSDLGNGHSGSFDEQYVDIRQRILRHTMLAFLVQAGVEYEHYSFGVPSNALIPGRLDIINGFVALDFRWSRKDLLRVQARPGSYNDGNDIGSAINIPVEAAYTRIVSNYFQWVVGLSYNSMRSEVLIPGGGFRYQISDRWKLQFFLPNPNIEYKARDDLHVFFGLDLRGDSYRVSKHFGDDRGQPALNGALLDYEELRIGPGFSWNIKPLLELNGQAGYIFDREFNFHDNGISVSSPGAPFVNIAIHWLFKLPGVTDPAIPQDTRIPITKLFSYF